MDSRETTFEHQRVAAARFNNIFLKLFDRHQWRIQDFFLGGGALVSCSTSTPVNQIVFFLFCRIPIVLENRRSSQRRGGVRTPCTLPLDRPQDMLYCYLQVDLKSFLSSGAFFLGREATERATISQVINSRHS